MASYVLSPNMYDRTRRVVLDAEGRPHGEDPATDDSRGNNWTPLISCYNLSSETIPAYGVARVVSGGLFGDDRTRILSIDKPSSDFAKQYVVNGPEAIEAGKWGMCYTGGMVLVLYGSGTPAQGEGYGPTPDQWYLTKNYPSILDCHGVAKSGETTMLGFLHPVGKIIGKLAGALSEGGSATVNVWSGAGNSEAVISSLTLTAFDWLLESGADDIASGKKVVVEWINGVPYVTAAECP